ncbi:MAG: thioredoxin domain-containing protein [Desulfobacteraceae bacterium]|nr:MAG: thioredoxin domain-containing protein [Desulfobacteraceae bacterium]
MKGHTNRLTHEKSPYLLQHAHNPVDWYPWSEEAFEKAAREDKPIFLSIGYSTCHWCHVMEKESFEDPEVAGLMNEVFVSIKVDREERPDLDHVYMAVCQMLTGRGGWPLTIVMTPEKNPFFAGTYIPKENRFGQMGMMELIRRIRDLWVSRRKDLLDSAASIASSLGQLEKETPGADLDLPVLDSAFSDLAKRFDSTYGGFGTAPKFPSPHNLLFLLRYWKRTGKEEALRMVEKTLQEIRWGGVYDHVGLGVHRYSTDREWLIPHFEKMLYDQAMLSLAYLEAYQATGKRIYEVSAREIFDYVMRDMTSPEGGFYSAEDADSEGVEGKFYLWEEAELKEILSPREADLAMKVFRTEREGNFREEATGKKTGANILYTGRSFQAIAAELGTSIENLTKDIQTIREKLFDLREKRIHPHKDDKVLTDWNGLMLAALAKGAQIIGEAAYSRAAERGARFIIERLRQEDGRLLHRYREGESGIQAHLDDYAFFVWGLIEIYQATFDAYFLKTAIDLNEDMIRRFWDHQGGGFFFTPEDGEKLIVRKKEYYDGATPSGNGVALHNLLRLARLTGLSTLEERAASLIRSCSGMIRQYPSGYTHLLSAVDFAIGPSFEVVIVGDPDTERTDEMMQALRRCYLPNQVTLFKSTMDESPEIDQVAPFIGSYKGINGETTAYVCRAQSCSSPTTDPGEMLDTIVYR